jgi:hypothetical protein
MIHDSTKREINEELILLLGRLQCAKPYLSESFFNQFMDGLLKIADLNNQFKTDTVKLPKSIHITVSSGDCNFQTVRQILQRVIIMSKTVEELNAKIDGIATVAAAIKAGVTKIGGETATSLGLIEELRADLRNTSADIPEEAFGKLDALEVLLNSTKVTVDEVDGLVVDAPVTPVPEDPAPVDPALTE